MSMVRLLHASMLAAVLVCGAWSAAGQTPGAASCETLLTAADAHYRQHEYEALEPLVLSCIYDAAPTPDETGRAYRLLALSYVNRGAIADARATVARLLTSVPGYHPDPTLDLPVYVSLVESVREQMQPLPARPEPPAAASPDAAPLLDAAPPTLFVDVNTATAEELDRVPGIGPALASRIIDFRTANGRFESVAALEAVRGIGPQSLATMAPFLAAGSGLAVPLAASAAAPAAAPADRPVINLNTATADELTALDGIGPALAQRIVEYRTAYGPFRRVEDVTNVRGIGPAKLEAIARQATVE